MDEASQARELSPSVESNVVNLFDPLRPVKHHEPAASDEELADFRKYWPLMKAMLKEWEKAKGAGGCPVLGEMFPPK